ncbi:MFS transporter [Streptomyces sp. NPDC006553]|uniref:MFS transporter n=1 Tax=Streptomyces sp. NPDC006553 TaxID=3157180 RepID=UPI0033A276AD
MRPTWAGEASRGAGAEDDGGGTGLGWSVLVAGFTLGVLAPTLHNATLTRAAADVGMDSRGQDLAQVLVVCASLAGLFRAGRAVDVHGARRVVLWSLLGTCAGGLLLVSAVGPVAYGAGLVVESASIMGVVAGYVASVPVLHLTGRLGRVVGVSFAAMAVALTSGVALVLAANEAGGWRAAEAVPPLLAAVLFVPAFRTLAVERRSTAPPAVSTAYKVGCPVLVLSGGVLQAAPLRSWVDAGVVTLLAVTLTVLAVCCTQGRSLFPVRPRQRRREAREPADEDSPVGAAVLAGGAWGFGQSALATVLLVLLTDRGGSQGESLMAWAGFGVGFAVAGLYAARSGIAARPAAALGLTLAAVGVAVLPVLPHGRSTVATAIAALLSVLVGFGIVLPQVPVVTRYLVSLPASGRGVTATAYPAAVVLGGAAVTGIPYEAVISPSTRGDIQELLWITVTVLALSAVVLGRSAVAIAVAGGAAAQYLLVTVVSEDRYAQRPLSLAAFAVTGVIVGLAVWARGRQGERLARALAAATALQQAVLRPLPARAGELEMADLYRPATADTGIGGDFYDVVRTPFGTRILIGDVRGKGLQAVQTVADVLGCFRSQAHETSGLAELAARLDRHLARSALSRQDGELFATALLLEHREGSDHLDALNCGHLPPLAVGPGHEVHEVQLPALLPLGFGGLDPDTVPSPVRLSLSDDTVLLLHTDGLSEARNAAGVFYPVAPRLRTAPTSRPRDLITHLMTGLAHWTHDSGDDIALIALTRSPEPPDAGALPRH